jgi:hypothetical protein
MGSAYHGCLAFRGLPGNQMLDICSFCNAFELSGYICVHYGEVQ